MFFMNTSNKTKLFSLILISVVIVASCYLFFHQGISFFTSKNHAPGLSLKTNHSGYQESNSPSIISSALNHQEPRQLQVLPYPPAPLDSLSEQEELDYPGAVVVEFAEVQGPWPNQKQRLRILQTHLKCTYVRTEEVVDASSGNLLGRLEMAANQLLVVLPEGKDPQQFLKEYGPQALSITPVSEPLPIYQMTLSDTSLASLPAGIEQIKQVESSVGSSAEPNYIGHLSKKPHNDAYAFQWGLWRNSEEDLYPEFRPRYENYFYYKDHGLKDLFETSADDQKKRNTSLLISSSLKDENLTNLSLGGFYAAAPINEQEDFSTIQGINAEGGWDVRTSAASVVVGIIDSGLRLTHESLKNNLWTNPKGKKHYIHGFSGPDMEETIADDVGHGTHCAGIIGGEANDYLGVAGVAWQVQLMPCKCANSEGVIIEDSILSAINFAKKNGASILNCSFGWSGSSASIAMDVVLNDLRKKEIILVAAAGNDGLNNDISLFKTYPASYSLELDNIVSVAATDYAIRDSYDESREQEGLASFSNYGEHTVSLAAPGTCILSTYNRSDNSYAFMSGTSMAAPFVTGALALIKAEYPNANYQDLIQHVIKTTDPLPSLDQKMIGGRLNLARALHTKPLIGNAWYLSTNCFDKKTSLPISNRVWNFLHGPCKRNNSIYQSL